MQLYILARAGSRLPFTNVGDNIYIGMDTCIALRDSRACHRTNKLAPTSAHESSTQEKDIGAFNVKYIAH